MNHLEIITSAANELSLEVSRLLLVGSFSPIWQENFGWRHSNEAKDDVLLFWLTKLAGIASTVHASVFLAKQGYWFQVSILSRSITEAQLSIAYTFPNPNIHTDSWPTDKQKNAIQEHFKETWVNPNKPFDDQRQRPHIQNLSAAFGNLQDGHSVLTHYDASQTAKQKMRLLSDYTHMAYPQVMELFSSTGGFRLAGNQDEKPPFGVMELGRLIVSSFIHAEAVCEFLISILAGCLAKAKVEHAEISRITMIQEKLQLATELLSRLEASSTKLESEFPSSDEEAKKVLQAFKQGKPVKIDQ